MPALSPNSIGERVSSECKIKPFLSLDSQFHGFPGIKCQQSKRKSSLLSISREPTRTTRSFQSLPCGRTASGTSETVTPSPSRGPPLVRAVANRSRSAVRSSPSRSQTPDRLESRTQSAGHQHARHIDTDHFAINVSEGATGVTGIDAGRSESNQRTPASRRTGTSRCSALIIPHAGMDITKCIADSDHTLSRHQVATGSPRDRWQRIVTLDLDQCQIVANA